MSMNVNRLSKKDIERLVSENSSIISFDKPKENSKSKISQYWTNFSQIYVSNVKQNLILCDTSKRVLVYKAARSDCMKVHIEFCNKTKLTKTNSRGEQAKISQFCKKIPIDKKKYRKKSNVISKSLVPNSLLTMVVHLN